MLVSPPWRFDETWRDLLLRLLLLRAVDFSFFTLLRMLVCRREERPSAGTADMLLRVLLLLCVLVFDGDMLL